MKEGLVTRLRAQLRRRISGRCSHGEMRARYDTSDVVQESMLQICREVEKGDRVPEDYSASLVKSIVKGHSVTLRNHHLAQKRAIANQLPIAEDTPTDQASPLDDAIQSEGISRLIRALSDFSDGDRDLIHLRVVKDLSFPLIAEELGEAEHTVRRRFNAIITGLKKELAAE